VEERVENLLGQMTLDEKTCQLATLYGYGRVLKDKLPTPGWKKEVWKDGIANIGEQLNGIPELGSQDKRNFQTQVDKINDLVWPPSNHAKALNQIQEWFWNETRLGIPVDFTNEGIRGLALYRATCFPSQLGIGATWNRNLVAKIGEGTAEEAKALGYSNIYSPVLDLARDPRWGRVVECYGEDPYHVWELVSARQLRLGFKKGSRTGSTRAGG
jgi:beta-glucosidase